VTLSRRTPMPRGTKPLTRTTTLPRGQGLARGQLKARISPWEGSPGVPMPGPRRSSLSVTRPTVTPEERWARAVVKARSGGWCELGCGREAQSWSHRVAKSQGGPWDATNGLALCSLGTGDPGCHTTIGRTNIPAGLAGRWRLNSWDDPATEPVWIRPSEAALDPGWYLLLPDGGLQPSDCGWPRPVVPWEAS
jgi:hypothetical protein